MKTTLDQPSDYHSVGRYKVPLLYFYYCFPTVPHPARKYGNLPPFDGGLYLDGHLFVQKRQWERIRETAATAAVKRNARYFRSLSRIAEQGVQRFRRLSTRLLIARRLTPSLVQSFFRSFNDLEYPWWLTLPIGEGLETVVASLMEGGVLTAEATRTFFALKQRTPLMQQHDELRNIRNMIDPSVLRTLRRRSPVVGLSYLRAHRPLLGRRIARHVRKYRWFGMMHFWGEPFTEEKCLVQLVAPQPRRQRIVSRTRRADWLQRVAADVTYWRQMCADTCAYASYAVATTFAVVSQRFGNIPYSEAMWLTPPEFLLLMKGRLRIDRAVLRQRQEGYGILQRGSRREIIVGTRLASFLRRFVPNERKATVLRGTAANRGRALGRVQIVLTPNDIHKVRRGDVMVSSETTPDFVPAMVKAAALVTDRGGISSHAAIVSRELGIPCIIGTKIATKVLKDGDRVEVDATRGIVRKL